MHTDLIARDRAADTLFYAAEAPDGFLTKLMQERVFKAEDWQTMWDAVASLIQHDNGMLDNWAAYDLSRIIGAVQALSHDLVGRSYDSLNDFEEHILEANLFISEIMSA
jgi:hypothetical protein